MNIYVKVSKFYDFVPTTEGDAEKQMADGTYAKRILVNTPSETTVIISDEQIATLLETSKQLVKDKDFMTEHPTYQELTEEDLVLQEFQKAMTHNAPQDAWGKIEVHDNVKMAKYLNNYFKETNK